MKYLDGFRNIKAAEAIRQRISELAVTVEQTVSVMEVCGSHTMAIARHGIRDTLPDNVKLISGPGCPVCVTSPGYIDSAIELAERDIILVSFGDMLNVPGSDASLAQCRASGGRIEICYTPAIAIELAQKNPDKEVVFLAIGFETTAVPVTSLIRMAKKSGIDNLSLLTSFKLVPPALSALLADPEVAVDSFLCPAHVSAIIGANAYLPFSGPQGVPCVVAGFEPLDILLGLQGVLEQVSQGRSEVENQYNRVVKSDGNPKAQQLLEKHLEPDDAHWRGIGILPASGLKIRPEFSQFDAATKHDITVGPGTEPKGCLCGDVIKGKISPPDCKMFATACTPDSPIGPCMVSAEGSCAAYYKYSRLAD